MGSTDSLPVSRDAPTEHYTGPFQSSVHPLKRLPPYQFYIVLPPMSNSFEWSPLFRLSNQTFVGISHFPHVSTLFTVVENVKHLPYYTEQSISASSSIHQRVFWCTYKDVNDLGKNYVLFIYLFIYG